MEVIRGTMTLMMIVVENFLVRKFLKKRLDPDDRSSHGEGDGRDGYGDERDSDDDSIGSDLYKDEDDRQELAQMTELDREMILADRAQKLSDRKFHTKYQDHSRTQPRQPTSPPSHSRGMRSSTRALDRAPDRDDALNEIRAKRARQQDPEVNLEMHLEEDLEAGAVLQSNAEPLQLQHLVVVLSGEEAIHIVMREIHREMMEWLTVMMTRHHQNHSCQHMRI